MVGWGIGYIRVSTTEQSREGLSLAVQRSRIETYCDLHGLETKGNAITLAKPRTRRPNMFDTPLLRGESPKWPDTIFGSHDIQHGSDARMRMIRTRDWKLVRHFEQGGQNELYDL